ncbi:ATP-dependent zinc metalloprotease FtsH [Fusicatenibacter saccharivorans]|uniref:ATP-dependent zinc metalloprotease FtsH n=1 Tax=Fusicatenibacter saccharivorans TaxID=1150298 RepID=UPI00156E8362|nr:ATP-dependent zinc metalloprotease FtsH [Fusicatenibacter saccharivorans]MCB5526349.1 ATP-dependent zinc metalloprotease FtsH [Fusicatenibacter saccharivorans]MCB5672526.1 ATP-dependent zinc metalloprotease FtsH [Fusicatenibacter saccharivorans]MCB5691652.1 ATP-dependent zinc metalloprotease FtsH [Fusicatenibacter saccharivorans]MCB5695303.1 ATP-dependent zinc metalloprotease FtsH [Fusicatenibacter saccharivorans]MCC2730780.1 ATP-dependent zinc metalloprotease FtsH [Fusicatenibacter sacchar
MKQVQKPKKPMIFYYVIALIVILLLNLLLFPRLLEPKVTEVDYGKFLQMVDNNEISEVQIQSNEIIFSDKSSPANYYKTGVMNDYKLVDRLYEAGITEFGTPIIEQMSPLTEFLLTWVIPIVVMVALGQWLMKRMTSKMMGGMGNAMSFGKSNAKVYVQSETGIKFADVAGEDEAKEILQEIVDFLHNPKKYEEIGAKMPKGALLVGPPGTGKTLLAKAVAGEANVPFFSISGSEFVEMFVGMGAAKVRDLFQQANEKAPCIVFIDEIDTVGKKRDGGGFSGNDEREQTLNQLLAEMDGFDGKKGVVILAATNRPDSLDPALLRPGRFDRRVPVELPDLKGREEILKVHAKNIRVGDNVDYNAIARMASGASGAELANMINEAALRAVRDGRKFVTQADLEESVEVVIAGYQKKNKIMTDKEKLIVSYHEVGHALVAALQSHSAPVTKITIIPRTSGALGYTMQVDEDEHNLMSREELENKIATLTGGRVAEDLVFHSITTGASNDIEQATKVARAMITRFGMNEEFGMVAFETVTNQYLGGDTSLACSESTAAQIDEKVVAAVRKQYDKAEQLLKDNMPKLHELAKYLYEKETITGDEFMEILNLSPDQLTTTRMETN